MCRLFTGIAAQQPKAVTFGISPGAGELIEIPTVTFGGDATALLFENRPGSDLEVLAHTRYEDNPRAFLDLVFVHCEPTIRLRHAGSTRMSSI